MREPRPTSRVRFAISLVAGCLVAGCLVAGCSGEMDVSGIYQHRAEAEAIQLVDPDRLGPHYLESRYLRLVVGQYGKDVAGVLKAYPDKNYNDYTSCSLILTGRLSGNKLRFSFLVYGPDDSAVMNAELSLIDSGPDQKLEGWLTLAGETERYAWLSLPGQAQEQLTDEDKMCTTGLARAPVELAARGAH